MTDDQYSVRARSRGGRTLPGSDASRARWTRRAGQSVRRRGRLRGAVHGTTAGAFGPRPHSRVLRVRARAPPERCATDIGPARSRRRALAIRMDVYAADVG